jgi:predicted DNA-binding transcriptional regulator AlpA
MVSDDEEWCGTARVRIRYNEVSSRTIDRWIRDPDLAFPQPTMINRRRFWRLGELRQWERQRAARRHERAGS